jgi:outer membrane receptor protein involved in Fe transport
MLGPPSRLARILWLFGLIATLISINARAQEPTQPAQSIRVEGIVRDASGSSVPGAQVALHAKSYSAAVTTDASGSFAFEHVPADFGTIVVLAKGLKQADQTWNAGGGSSTHIEIILAPEPVSQNIVVTAARTPTLLSDVPVSDARLTSDDLRATPALNLDDQLRQIPGFSLFRRSSSRTANPTTQGVSLRGLAASGASRALVLEDGIPLNDPFGAWVYWDRVPSQSIASIEVAQEGASSLYGSDALGGVVQVLTRPAEPSGISLETSYGNQNSPNFSLWAGGQKGAWEATFGGEVFNTDGYILIPSDVRGAVDTRAGVSDGVADLMIGRKIGSSSEIFARGWYFGESRDNGTPLQTNETRLAQGALGANLQLGSFGALTLRFYGDAQTFHQNFSSVASDRNSETITDVQTVPSQGVGGSALWSRSAGSHQTLVAGFDAHEEIGRSDELLFSKGKPSADQSSGGRQRAIGLFGEDLIQIAPRWLLSASVRFDDWRNFDASLLRSPIAPPGPPVNTPFPDRSNTALSPRLTLLHQMNANVSWTASVYRAFRAPTLNELYRSFRQGNTVTEDNPNLNAERLTGGEAGVAVNGFHRRVEVRGTFFFNEMIDPIANVTCGPVAPPAPCAIPPGTSSTVITRQRLNLGRTTAPGFEIDAIAHITNRFQLSAGYQYVDATVSSFPGETALVGLWIAQVPRNVLTFQARYTNPSRISFTVDGRMVGKQFDDDQNQFPLGRFFVLDAMASRNIGAGVEIFAAAENLLNEQYATAATPVIQLGLPISARFGFRFQFPRR